ncbi:MAG TPA: hypothetical protein VHD56_15505 [Tepidisphaeraceae bacterium]|nr:hypothetical protein [Tepidisphaeraceae bacterium]
MQELQVKALLVADQQAPKRPYVRPELVKYGSVEQFTLVERISQILDV